MRKPNSITGKTYDAINSYDIGQPFTVNDIYNSGDLSCSSVYGSKQRLYDLLCMLIKTGLIQRVKRGTYMKKYNIPAELTSTDVEMYCGYTDGQWVQDPNAGWITLRKKVNPFDIKAYKAACDADQVTRFNPLAVFQQTKEEMFPQASAVAPPKPETLTVYGVNPKNGAVTEFSVPCFDESYKAKPFVFDSFDAAFAFAEGFGYQVEEVEDDGNLTREQLEKLTDSELMKYAEKVGTEEFIVAYREMKALELADSKILIDAILGETEDDDLSIALDEIENDIASTLMRESNPESDFLALKDSYLTMDLAENDPIDVENKTQSLGQFVALIVPVGTPVYLIDDDTLNEVTLVKDVVEFIEIVVGKDVEYIFECENGTVFNKADLGVKVFTDKKEAATRLLELI